MKSGGGGRPGGSGGSPRQRREKGAERLFKEVMAKTFPNLGREMDTLIYLKPMDPK